MSVRKHHIFRKAAKKSQPEKVKKQIENDRIFGFGIFLSKNAWFVTYFNYKDGPILVNLVLTARLGNGQADFLSFEAASWVSNCFPIRLKL